MATTVLDLFPTHELVNYAGEVGLKITDLVASNLTEYRQQMVKQLVTDPEVRSKGLEWFDTHKGMFEVLQALDTFLGEMLDGGRV